MAQSDFGTINPATKSGTTLASDLNGFRNALNTMHKGASRPAYAQAGTMWIKDISGTTQEIYVYDGSDDILLFTFNPTANNVTFNIPDGAIAPTKINDGSGSGLDADLLDGLESTAFVRSDANTTLTNSAFIRYRYAIREFNTDDGKIGPRLTYRGMNIYGNATENADSNRYISFVGISDFYGNINVTGQVAASSTISTTGNVISILEPAALEATLQLYRANNTLGWFVKHNSSGHFSISSGATIGAQTERLRIESATGVWNNTYGWLHDWFARRATIAGSGTPRVYVTSGSGLPLALSDGWEVYDTGDGQHRVRRWVENCQNCSNCNCDCESQG
jgi:hypothetical protein